MRDFATVRRLFACFHFLAAMIGAQLLGASLLGVALLGMAFASTGVGTLAAAETPEPEEPKLAPASDEAEKSLAGFRIPKSLKGTVFAAEPLVGNPVAFTIDGRGRVYVCESYRQEQGIEDNRKHGYWLEDDQAAQTVEDRRQYMLKHRKDKEVEWQKKDDRIRLLTDTNGDGRADEATVFARKFNNLVDGTGAGVISFRGSVYYTCIPDLWQLKDENGDGVADVRKSLQTGYGVRFAFRGHDLHGLTVGPDGKLYFSIGDRGFNLVVDGRRWANPECGAVFRCNPDGSDFEVVAYGLRNPQELTFDDYGNLFTCDNNSDSGDKARWTTIVEGGDTGWRMSYQYLPDRGPFNREKIWHPWHDGQPAYIVPPILNLSSGPSGLAYYPGTGLSEHFDGRFFLCDFRGAANGSGVRTFRVREKGAFYEVADEEETLWNILATDVEFGPDGGVYVSDWVNGWTGLNKGRIYRFADPEAAASPIVAEVKQLLSEDLTKKQPADLAKLLAHRDRRVRQAAQFALVDLKQVDALSKVAADLNVGRLGRLHAIWGLGQLASNARTSGAELATKAASVVAPLLDDGDAEVRAQSARVLGDARHAASYDALVKRLDDAHARTRYFAAVALGKLGRPTAIGGLLKLLADNDNQDPIVRHGAIVALARIGGWKLSTPVDGSADALTPEQAEAHKQLAATTRHPSAATRLGVTVALRKLRSPLLAEFLRDGDERVVLEAARGIHDEPIEAALPALATVPLGPASSDALARRVVNASYRTGEASGASRLAGVAARGDLPEALRLEALKGLGEWNAPPTRDRVLNIYRPLAKRPGEPAVAALKELLPQILARQDKAGLEGAKLAARLGIGDVGPALVKLFEDLQLPAASRAEALKALLALKDSRIETFARAALTDKQPLVRAAGLELLAELKPQESLPLLEQAAASLDRVERQAALATLGGQKKLDADPVLARAFERLKAGEVPADSRLDLLDALAARKSPAMDKLLAEFENARPTDDPLAKFAETLVGGDARRGAAVFFERAQVSCVRCHRVDGRGGDVGPDLSKIGGEKNRPYLLESIVLPNKTIAKNFESVLIVDNDGRTFSGIVKADNDQHLQLMTAEGKLLTIAKSAIDERREGKSAMPEDLIKQLSRSDIRDLVEFLSNRK